MFVFDKNIKIEYSNENVMSMVNKMRIPFQINLYIIRIYLFNEIDYHEFHSVAVLYQTKINN